jgi:hypothetical protein
MDVVTGTDQTGKRYWQRIENKRRQNGSRIGRMQSTGPTSMRGDCLAVLPLFEVCIGLLEML